MIGNISLRQFYPGSKPAADTATPSADRKFESNLHLESSQTRPEKEYGNSQLIKRYSDGRRQYLLKGTPWHNAYSDKRDGDTGSKPKRIGAGRNNFVMGRRNSEAPFYLKKGKHYLSIDEAKKIMENTNEVTSIVEGDDFLRKHCAVEVVTKIDRHPQNPALCKITFLTPKVEGTVEAPTFTLGDLKRTPNRYQKYFSSSEESDRKLKNLFDVHLRLFEKGYVHVDAQNPENIVYNTNTGDFVLIDFEPVKMVKEILEQKEIGSGTRQEVQKLFSRALTNGESVETLAAKFSVEEQSIRNLLS